jgi:hypothetical protein
MKLNRATALLIGMLSAVLALSGCGRGQGDKSDDKVVTAYKLIDAGRDEEAVAMLEDELTRLPGKGAEHNRLTVVLASAYAHRAGFKVQRLAKVFAAGKNKVKFDVGLKLDNNPKFTKEESVDRFLAGVSVFFASIANLNGYYTAVPNIRPDKVKYLEFAVRLLDSIDNEEIEQGDALYRAVLKTVYLKYYIANNVVGIKQVADINLASCSVDFDKTAVALKEIGRILIDVLGDLGRAQPSKSPDYVKQQYKVSAAVGDLTSISTSVSLVDEVTMRTVKRTLVQTGLQNLLKCTATGGSTTVSLPGLPASAAGLLDSLQQQ